MPSGKTLIVYIDQGHPLRVAFFCGAACRGCLVERIPGSRLASYWLPVASCLLASYQLPVYMVAGYLLMRFRYLYFILYILYFSLIAPKVQACAPNLRKGHGDARQYISPEHKKTPACYGRSCTYNCGIIFSLPL